MNWRVRLDPLADDFLRKQDAVIEQTLRKKLRKLTDPLRHIASYHGEYYKVRLGSYRALVSLSHAEQIVTVHVIGHRKNIYKRH